MKIQYQYKDTKYTVLITQNDTIGYLKKKIIASIHNEKINYIDLKVICDNPIREFGKLTINSEIFPRYWDNRKIDHFPNKLSDIFIEIISVLDYQPNIKKKKNFNKNTKNTKYILPSQKQRNITKTISKSKLTYNYNTDFPPL